MGVVKDRAIWEAQSDGYELLNSTIGDVLDRQAEAFPDKEAFVYNYPELGRQLRLTYRQYRETVNQLAKGLLALGIEKGEHVGVWAPNVPEWAFLELALAKVGAVLVTVNTAYKAAELEYVLRQGDVTTLFTVEELRGNSYVEALLSTVPELQDVTDPLHERLRSPKLPRFKRAILLSDAARPGFLPYEQAVALGASITDADLAARQASVLPGDTVQMQYTSGTTGFPKGAMLTHRGHLNNALLGTARAGIQSTDRMVSAMPLFHVAGCVGGLLFMLVVGGTYIPLLMFDPVKELELIANEQGTLTFAVPTMLLAMLNHPRFLAGEFDISSLRAVLTGATPVPVVLIERVKAEMGADSHILFGLTEASGIVTQTLPTDPYELKSATVGITLPYTDVKLILSQSGEVVGFGETGELLTRGFAVMQGYYNMPDKTAEAIDEEGWLHTGDLATMTPQGYINIVGRAKDMIIRGGENLYPAEIEALLLRHPKVADAQVVGVPDAFMGEEAVALLRLKPDEQADENEIRDFCRAVVSRHKVPKYIRFVAAYPMTASGKVKKFELRAQLIHELGLEEVAKTKTA